MSSNRIVSAFTLFGCAIVIMAHVVTAQAATPKKKGELKPIIVKSLMCEGTTTRASSNGFAGEVRDTRQLTFAAKLTPASSEALIMGVNGSVTLKPGRHLMTRTEDGKAHEITIPFTDYDGMRDSLRMFIYPNGDFSAYSTAKTMSTPGRDLMCGFIGPELCSVSEVKTRVEMSGVCWPAK